MERKISFFVKEAIPCPVCGTPIFREDILTGRGRFIAKNLTRELRREYEPIPGIGLVSPFSYSISTCPSCLISLFNSDLAQIKLAPEHATYLKVQEPKRQELVEKLFKKQFQFAEPRDPLSAAASYYLALVTYPPIPPKYSPAIKCAIASIRLYWLVGDFIQLYPEQTSYWQGIHNTLKLRTFNYLDTAYNKIFKREEDLPFFGPDTDRNNGFEGLIYIHHYFQYMTMPRNNPIVVEQTVQNIRRDLSRVFGIGKPSKERPTAILDLVRELYEDVKKELQSLNVPPDPEDA